MHIKVKVTSGAKKETIEKIDEDTFYISVKEKAEKNRANTRVLELVADRLSVPLHGISIITGHHSPSKILFVRDT